MKAHLDARHIARRVALSTAYCMSQQSGDLESCLNLSLENLQVDPQNWDNALTQEILTGITAHKEEINQVIQNNAPQWPLDKIFKIDLVILQIAIFELLFNESEATKAPGKVLVDEAIELAKEFGNETSSKFVNGVLGSILESMNTDNKDADKI